MGLSPPPATPPSLLQKMPIALRHFFMLASLNYCPFHKIRTPWSACHSLQHPAPTLSTRPNSTQHTLRPYHPGEYLKSILERIVLIPALVETFTHSSHIFYQSKFQARTTIGLVYTPATFFIFFFRTILILYPDRVNIHQYFDK